MELKEFIERIADQFDDTDISEFVPTTNFKELEEWSSLTALAVLNMIAKKYNINIKNGDLLEINSIEELFNYVLSKQ
ncbi:acyl carrier protein [Tannerella sp. oral taxon 808]|nr:acyl carrier protein [Tannerella sp. oral taxon 808]